MVKLVEVAEVVDVTEATTSTTSATATSSTSPTTSATFPTSTTSSSSATKHQPTNTPTNRRSNEPTNQQTNQTTKAGMMSAWVGKQGRIGKTFEVGNHTFGFKSRNKFQVGLKTQVFFAICAWTLYLSLDARAPALAPHVPSGTRRVTVTNFVPAFCLEVSDLFHRLRSLLSLLLFGSHFFHFILHAVIDTSFLECFALYVKPENCF